VFDEIFASTNVPLSIPDNNPGGVLDEIAIEDIGTIREIAVSVDISSSDISQLTVVLYDPENVAHTLHDKSDSGAALATTYPTDTSLVSGDLDEWIGKSPYGTWRLIVSDWSDSGISFDGELIGWSINIEVLSDIKIGINGYMDGLAPIIGVNFAGADLGGMDFQKQALPYANFEGANLRSANFEDSRLNHANFSNSDVEGVYWYNVICPSGYRVSSVSGTCCDHWTDETTGVIGCDEED
jgi:subtilisin-like proprotein convertase family protein